MAIIFDDDVSGAGWIDFGADLNLDRVTVTILSRPPNVRMPDLAAEDHLIGCGWLALGYPFSEGDQPAATFWTTPRYVAFDTYLWANFTDSNGPVRFLRYLFTPSVTAHLLIGA